jgi:hypothetical protein
MACPICVSPDSSSLAEGIRAGVATLILVATLVAVPLARFAWRLWQLRGLDAPPPAQARPAEDTA